MRRDWTLLFVTKFSNAESMHNTHKMGDALYHQHRQFSIPGLCTPMQLSSLAELNLIAVTNFHSRMRHPSIFIW